MDEANAVAYVLDVGLPPTPSRLGGGRLIPVAVWAGERFGAVMVVEDDPNGAGPLAMTYTFRRVDGGWEPSRGAGGTEWPGGTSSSASSGLGSREVLLDGGEYGMRHMWTCHLVEGFAGETARWVELEEASGTDRRPIAPTGAVLAVRQGDGPATVRVLDADGALLNDWNL